MGIYKIIFDTSMSQYVTNLYNYLFVFLSKFGYNICKDYKYFVIFHIKGGVYEKKNI